MSSLPKRLTLKAAPDILRDCWEAWLFLNVSPEDVWLYVCTWSSVARCGMDWVVVVVDQPWTRTPGSVTGVFI